MRSAAEVAPVLLFDMQMIVFGGFLDVGESEVAILVRNALQPSKVRPEHKSLLPAGEGAGNGLLQPCFYWPCPLLRAIRSVTVSERMVFSSERKSVLPSR